MKQLLKQLAPFVTIQLLCVAVGLFMHHQFLVHVTGTGFQESVWQRLMQDATRMGMAWERSTPALSTEESGARRALEKELNRLSLRAGGVVVVDNRWKVLASAGAPQDDRTVPPSGATLGWVSNGDPEEPATNLRRGIMTFQDQTCLAAAQPLPGGLATVVVFRAKDKVAAEAAALTKPVSSLSAMALLWIGALLVIVDYLVLARIMDHGNRAKAQADTESLKRTQNLVRTRDAVIFGLAKLADSRDPETGDHLERISLYTETLTTALHRNPRYADIVTPSFISIIRISSVLHDIGKVGIEDAILRKKTALSAVERERMQCHTKIGGECLREIERRLGSSNFLQMAREIALAHHEKWDGSGYPDGLCGSQIPLPARIVAIADVYDALASQRVYKSAFDHVKCVDMILRESGKHFDPDLVEVWLSIEAKFREIALRYKDRRAAAARTGEGGIREDRMPGEPSSEGIFGESPHATVLAE